MHILINVDELDRLATEHDESGSAELDRIDAMIVHERNWTALKQILSEKYPAVSKNLQLSETLDKYELGEGMAKLDQSDADERLKVFRRYSASHGDKSAVSVLFSATNEIRDEETPSVWREYYASNSDCRRLSAAIRAMIKFCNQSVLEATESRLSLLLRYLCLVSNMHFALKGLDTPFPLANRLLSSDQEAASVYFTDNDFPDSADLAVSNEEVDLLCQTVSIAPLHAGLSIKCAGGSLDLALVKQLMLIPYNQPLLQELVEDYKTYRCLNIIEDYQATADVKSKLAYLKNVRNAIADAYNGKFDDRQMTSAILEVKNMFPDLEESQQAIAFGLYQLQFMEYLSIGNHKCALDILHTKLTPISASFEFGQDLVKDYSLQLFDANSALDTMQKYVPKALPSMVYNAMSQKVTGSEKPALLTLIEQLVDVHESSLKERSMEDRFESILNLDKLKMLVDTPAPSRDQTRGPSPEEAETMLQQLSHQEHEAAEHNIQETDIETLMSIVGCSRTEAIHWLVVHDGNVENALNSIFSGN